MDDFFDDFFISQGLGASKPSKDFYARAFARLNAGRRLPILPEETVMIGDRIYTDIACGVNAGIDTALMLSGEATLQDAEQSPVKPTWIFRDIRAFLTALQQEAQAKG